MDMDTLREKLDEFAWDEQMAFEMSERHPESWEEDQRALEKKIRLLADSLRPADLDALENEPGYQIWALRLSPYIPGDDPVVRARRLSKSSEAKVRQWAYRLLEEES
jgi:hypothetical protein